MDGFIDRDLAAMIITGKYRQYLAVRFQYNEVNALLVKRVTRSSRGDAGIFQTVQDFQSDFLRCYESIYGN